MRGNIRRAPTFAAIGSILLVMSVGLAMAQSPMPVGGVNSDPEGTALPASDGPIGAQDAPSVSIAAPSAAIGDFGANLGNVWDMDSTSDIVWRQENFPIWQAAPGVVAGRTGSHVLGLATYASSTNNVPATQYHHITYKLKIAGDSGCRTNGRVAYAKKWPDWFGSSVSSYPFLPFVPPMSISCSMNQFCVYYLDLSRNDNYPDWPTWHTASGTDDNPSTWVTDPVKSFAIVPNEWCVDGGEPDHFELDFVYLTGDIVAREADGYQYVVKWQVSDPDGGLVTSRIRYQEVDELQLPEDSPTCGASNFDNPSVWKDFSPVAEKTTNLQPPPSYPNKTFLPMLMAATSGGGLGPYNETYTLDFSDDAQFADGKSYYLCIRVDDGTAQDYEVSTAPVIRVPISPYFGPD